VPPAGALFRARGDQNLNLGIRKNDGADIAAVEHCARRGAAEIPLEGQERGPHLRNGGNQRGRLADGLAPQRLFIEAGRIERARGGNRPGGVVEPMAAVEERLGDRAIEQAAVEMAQPEMSRQPLAERALAGGGRPVDGNDHAIPPLQRERRIAEGNPGRGPACQQARSLFRDPHPTRFADRPPPLQGEVEREHALIRDLLPIPASCPRIPGSWWR
jgi:hypothetical protein